MPDPRVVKLAEIMVDYSLELKPGQQVWLRTSPVAQEFNLAFYDKAVRAEAHVLVDQVIPGAEESLYKYATDAQLDFIAPYKKLVAETFDASLRVWSDENTRALAGVDPSRIARGRKAGAGLFKTVMQRAATGTYRWCVTVHPTAAMAQDANMSLADYADFVYAAGMLNEPDPVGLWRTEGKKQEELIGWLKGRKNVMLKGANVDLQFSIEGRTFQKADGLYNFPDGEIFTSPVDGTANGWVRFRYPGIYAGQEVEDIELWFEAGRVVREKASRNQPLLTSLLDTDPGARNLGEWGIGTNYGITRFSRNMLFDEKIGGTIHLAMGQSFPECGGTNESGLHWDMLCDMADSEIKVDGDVFYRNGKFSVS
jgi:aminopeptidase